METNIRRRIHFRSGSINVHSFPNWAYRSGFCNSRTNCKGYRMAQDSERFAAVTLIEMFCSSVCSATGLYCIWRLPWQSSLSILQIPQFMLSHANRPRHSGTMSCNWLVLVGILQRCSEDDRHTHMMFPLNYDQDCKVVIGSLLHHDPWPHERFTEEEQEEYRVMNCNQWQQKYNEPEWNWERATITAEF